MGHVGVGWGWGAVQWVMKGWGGSCRSGVGHARWGRSYSDGVGHTGVGWVIKWWVGWVIQEWVDHTGWGGSCRGGVGWVMHGCGGFGNIV